MASTAVSCFRGLVTYAPEIHRISMYTECTYCTINGMLLHTEYKTHVVFFENPRTPLDGGGGARMLDVRVSRGRGCLCL